MKKSSLTLLLSLLTAISAVGADKECPPVSDKVREEVTANPQNVLSIVGEKIAANPGCACEIVKAAIGASKADKDLVGQIVYTAVVAAPAQATTIAECAVAAAPEASETIKAALKSGMSDDKNPSGKNVVDKNPPPKEEELADFGLSPVAIGGVYLIYPSAGGSGTRLIRKDGKLAIIGPDGKTIFIDQDEVQIIIRPGRPPKGGGGTSAS